MRFNNEFEKYAIQHFGIGSNNLDYYQKDVLQNSLTPYVLEEREMRVTQIDIFSRMMLDRIIWFTSPVDTRVCTITQAQLMFLDNTETKDIQMYINSPGGGVSAGLSLLNTMDYIVSDVSTLNLGLAASMGSILLGGGTKGKRYSLADAKVMLHTVSSGMSGKIQDMDISFEETKKANERLFEYLATFTGKTKKQLLKDADRDLWLNAQQALEYGIIDGIITKRKK